MPYGSVTLVPGLNVLRTPTLLRAGFSATSLIRFRDSLAQKYGGWAKFIPFAVIGTPRHLHAWQDLNATKHLAVGSTARLDVITGGVLDDVTPQILTTNPAPNFSTTINSPVVTIVDPSVTVNTTVVYNSIFFNVPISVGGLILDGLYQITQFVSAHSYQITVAENATATSSPGTVPVFTTTTGSAVVNVKIVAHGLNASDPARNTIKFAIPTTVNGVIVTGLYKILAVVDADNFQINAGNQATATGPVSMNGGNAQLVYYITPGPTPPGSGYGVGGYGRGGYGLGQGSSGSGLTGNPITAMDWTIDNFGQILMACPEGGGIYYFDPTGGFVNAQVISAAPPFNEGMFVSMAQQIVVAFGSSAHQGIGWQKQPLLVKWCDVGNFFQWDITAATQAGDYTLSPGSAIIAGLAGSNQNLLWTDLDLWAMNYIGPPDVYGFNKIGAGMGAVSLQSIQQLRGSTFWMGPTNFYAYQGGGANVVPCPVWDAVFQNLNTAFLHNIRAMPNTPFNEVGWLYPSAASMSGECDSYVKMNIAEQGTPWDIGPLQRSAWIDQTVLGMPVGASPQGFIYQHETTPDADGVPLSSTFTTGEYFIGEGEDFCFVDQVIPDFVWTVYPGGTSAQVLLTFNVTDYPGDTPRQYGPFAVTKATEFITTRFRGRLMSISVQSTDLGSFWRVGSCKYRYSAAGRR